jgi:hypothetical protein
MASGEKEEFDELEQTHVHVLSSFFDHFSNPCFSVADDVVQALSATLVIKGQATGNITIVGGVDGDYVSFALAGQCGTWDRVGSNRIVGSPPVLPSLTFATAGVYKVCYSINDWTWAEQVGPTLLVFGNYGLDRLGTRMLIGADCTRDNIQCVCMHFVYT